MTRPSSQTGVRSVGSSAEPASEGSGGTLRKRSSPYCVERTSSAGLVIVLGLLSLSYRRIWASWAIAVIGGWLLLAPLVFWSPSAARYANDTLIGVALIAMTILVGGISCMMLDHAGGSAHPAA